MLGRTTGTITPPMLMEAAGKIGWGSDYDSGQMLARKLEDDGWIRIQSKPWTGRGMNATWAYDATNKWKELGR